MTLGPQVYPWGSAFFGSMFKKIASFPPSAYVPCKGISKQSRMRWDKGLGSDGGGRGEDTLINIETHRFAQRGSKFGVQPLFGGVKSVMFWGMDNLLICNQKSFF